MVFERVCNIIVEKLNINQADIELESSLKEDFNVDSLDLVELVMAIEDEFGITFDDSDFDKIQTVKDAVDYIEERL